MMSPADRQRKYRARKQMGVLVAPVPVSSELVVDLVDAGWLEPASAESRQAVADALSELLAWWRARFGADSDVPSVTRHAIEPVIRDRKRP